MSEFDEAIKFMENKQNHECSSEIFHKNDNVIKCLQHNKKLEKENAYLKETIKNLRCEGDEYQKSLDQIDLWAMEIQELIKKIRGKI